MEADPKLETFWITFPGEVNAPFGIGVTAYDELDALALIRDQGILSWFSFVESADIKEGVRIGDLDAGKVVPNMGPMQFRGVWYPQMNIGWGAPMGSEFVSLAKK